MWKSISTMTQVLAGSTESIREMAYFSSSRTVDKSKKIDSSLRFCPWVQHFCFLDVLYQIMYEMHVHQSHLWQLYLAGEDVAKCREGVVQGFVVNGLVKVLDEHVAHSGLPEGGVSLGPHDSDWLPFHHVKVHSVQGSFSWVGGRVERWRERSWWLFTWGHESENISVTSMCSAIPARHKLSVALTAFPEKQHESTVECIKTVCPPLQCYIHNWERLLPTHWQHTSNMADTQQWPCGWWAAGTGVRGSCSGQAGSTWPPSQTHHRLLSHVPPRPVAMLVQQAPW